VAWYSHFKGGVMSTGRDALQGALQSTFVRKTQIDAVDPPGLRSRRASGPVSPAFIPG
jgi:hypothetical protein